MSAGLGRLTYDTTHTSTIAPAGKPAGRRQSLRRRPLLYSILKLSVLRGATGRPRTTGSHQSQFPRFHLVEAGRVLAAFFCII